MGRKIVIWTGNEWEMGEGQTMKEFLEELRNGEIVLMDMDYVRITESGKNGKEILNEEY